MISLRNICHHHMNPYNISYFIIASPRSLSELTRVSFQVRKITHPFRKLGIVNCITMTYNLPKCTPTPTVTGLSRYWYIGTH